MTASKLTKADLVTTIEGLRAEIETLRITAAQLVTERDAARTISAKLMQRIEELQAKPAPGKPAYVRRPDPLAAKREAYHEMRKAAAKRAVTERVFVPVPTFDAWLAAQAQ